MKKVPVKIIEDKGQLKYGYGEGIWSVISLNRLDQELFDVLEKRVEEKHGVISYVSPYEIIAVFPFSAKIENIESFIWEMGEKELKKYVWKAGINGGGYGFMLLEYEDNLYGSIFGKEVNETRKILREENNYTIIINREMEIKDVPLEIEEIEWRQFKYRGEKGEYKVVAVSKYEINDIGVILKWGTPLFISPGEILPFIWIKVEADIEDVARFCLERNYTGGCLRLSVQELIMGMVGGEDIKMFNNILLDIFDSSILFTDLDFKNIIAEPWKEIMKKGEVLVIKKLSLNVEVIKVLSVFKKGLPVNILKKSLGNSFKITSDIDVIENFNIAITRKEIKVEEKERKKIKYEILKILLSQEDDLKDLLKYYIKENLEEDFIELVEEIIKLLGEEGDYARSLDFIVKTLALLPEGDETKKVRIKLRLEKGKVLKTMSRYSDAEEDFRYVMWAAVSKGMEELKIESMLELGNVLYFSGKLDDAEKWIKEAMDKAEESILTLLFFKGGLLLARLYTTKGFYSRANSVITSLEKEIEANSSPELLLDLLTIKSSIYIKEGQYDLARDTLLDAISISSKHGFQKEELFQYINLGNIHLEQQNFDEAYHYFDLALKKANAIDNKRGKMLALYNLGIVEIERKHYNESQNYLSEGLKLASEDKMQKVLFLQALGDLKVNMNNFFGAEKYIKEAYSLAKEIESKDREGKLLLRYGYIVGYLMKEDEAIKYLKQAQKIFEKLKDVNNKTGAELNIIYFNLRKKNLDLLEEELNKIDNELFKEDIDIVRSEIALYKGNLKFVEEALKTIKDESSILKLNVLFNIHTGDTKSFNKNYRKFLENEKSVKNLVEVSLESLGFMINHKTEIDVKEISAHIDAVKDFIPEEMKKFLKAYFDYFSNSLRVVEIKTEDNIFTILLALLNARIYFEQKKYEKAFNILKNTIKIAEKNRINVYLWKIYLGLNHIILKRIVAREIFPDAAEQATEYENKAYNLIKKIKSDFGLNEEVDKLLDKEVKLWSL